MSNNTSVTRSKKQEKITNSASDQQGEIRFYRSNQKPYGVFSNLYRCEFVFEGRTYPTAEHAYQAGKARTDTVREWILSAPSPALVSMAAHGLYTWDVVPNWAQVKYDRMRRVLRAKFEQHGDLMALLMSTGEDQLVEAATVDSPINRLWGEVNGRGKNMLGVMLMELRAEFRQTLESARALASDDIRTANCCNTVAKTDSVSSDSLYVVLKFRCISESLPK
ncbi:MAG: NADAR family protein [Methylococcales bacterium]